MITPIGTLNINQIAERKDDLIVSSEDIKAVAKNERNKAIDNLCNEFRKDWEEQCENNMEDCINWYDWLLASAEQLKGGAE